MSGLRGLWWQWLPTSLGSSMLVLEIPIVAAAVARSDDAARAVAALGVGIAVIVVVNSPALALAPLVVSVQGRADPVLLRRYTLLVGTIGAALVAAVGAAPAALAALLDLDAATAAQVRGALLALAPGSVAVAVRRYLHGRLIAAGVTGGIAWATGLRLAASAAIAWGVVPLTGAAAAAGAAALTVGAFAEAAGLAVALRRVSTAAVPALAPCPSPEPPPVERAAPRPCTEPASAAQPGVGAGLRELAAAHVPVAASRMLNMVPQFATTIGVAHAAAALPSLTAWPVLYGLLSLFTGPLADFETVAAAALRRHRADPQPLRMAVTLSAAATAAYGLVLLTPLARGYLAGLSGLTGEPLRLGLTWGVLTLLVPAGWVLRGYLRGIALADGRRAPIAYGALVHLAGLTAVLVAGVLLGLPGLAVASLAVGGGVLAELLALVRSAAAGAASARPERVGVGPA
jgi:hypothetical protein